MTILFTLSGIVGVTLAVAAYFATQKDWLKATDWQYPAANLAGACLIGVSLVDHWNLPSALIQLVFGIISLYGLLRLLSWQSVNLFLMHYWLARHKGLSIPAAVKDARQWA